MSNNDNSDTKKGICFDLEENTESTKSNENVVNFTFALVRFLNFFIFSLSSLSLPFHFLQ